MSEIFIARQRGLVALSRLVVVKRILPHLAEEPQFVEMFLEEARLASLVNHPNVVQIFDVDQYDGQYYIAMEYIGGPSVSALVRRLRAEDRAFPYPVAAEIVAQACEGLHAAHELSDESGAPLLLVHRDVSPHNLMIAENGQVKLVDFGIAKARGSAVQTRSGNIKGKYPYMSPEQCRGEPLDRRTDIFSVGVVFFELVTGRRIFQRATELHTLKAITEERIPLAREIRPDVPEEISEVIRHAMQRNRDQRFGTAAEMGLAVRGALSGLSVPTTPTTVAAYVASEHGEILAARAEAIRKVSQLTSPGTAVPLIEGFAGPMPSSTRASEVPTPSSPIQALAGRAVRRRRRLALAGALLVLALASLLGIHLSSRRTRPTGALLQYGVPPIYPDRVIASEMAPLISYLERRLHRPTEIVISRDYRTLRDDLLSGRLHMASLPPLVAVLARRQNPKLQMVASHLYEGARTYQALIVTRDDSGIAAPAQLRGKRFCYVDGESTSGYLMPRSYLRRSGLDPDRLFAATRFSGNHFAVLKDVFDGKCDAGAVYSGAVMNAAQQGVPPSRLRILASAGNVSFDVVCASPRLPPALVRDLRRALLEMEPRRDLGRDILGPNFRISGFAEPRLEDFHTVEEAARAEGLLR
jgi:serine/threonine-protein kinase